MSAKVSIANGGDDLGKVECTRSFIEELAEYFGIPYLDLDYAFQGESRKTALRVCESVEEKEIVSPRRRGEEVTRWAKKYRKGVYRYSSRPGPSDASGVTVTPDRSRLRSERFTFSNEQIAQNLDRMGREL